MKSLKLLIALLAIAIAPGAVQAAETSADTGAITAKLKHMENDWGDALLNKDHGVAVVSHLVADDFSGVNSKGNLQSKSGLIDELQTAKETLTTSTTDSMEVHVYGSNVALVCGTSTEGGKMSTAKPSLIATVGSTPGWSATANGNASAKPACFLPRRNNRLTQLPKEQLDDCPKASADRGAVLAMNQTWSR